MFRRISILGMLAFIYVCTFAGTSDWVSLSSQSVQEDYWVYYPGTDTANSDSTAVFRAYVESADTSDADNQFDATWVRSNLHRWTNIERSGRYTVYRIDSAVDTLYAESIFLHGRLAAKDAVDDTTLADGAVTLDKVAADAINSSKIVDGSLAEADYGTTSIPTAALQDLAVTAAKVDTGLTPDKLATGGRLWFGTPDSAQFQTIFTARISPPTGGGAVELTGAREIYGGTDVKSGGDITVESGGSLIAESGSTVEIRGNATLGNSASDVMTFQGAIQTERYDRFGNGSGDTTAVAGRITTGTTFAAGDSASASLNVQGGHWMLNRTIAFQDTIAGGTSTLTVKVAGVESGDFAICWPIELSGSTAANNVVSAKCYDGEIHFDRGGSTNDIIFGVIVVKRGPSTAGF
ncbi:MAG: hypothetical protein KC729_00155 [Candidatus Eisenbacteria bacterium]|uniref:Uncharacterized protein n=1 Tax=Eiseniibacteriota bacterium TaxID=2212470 RepID=A0A956LW59_UNCEI|nr:hypothetical protein [Candidatus Eisenbacteria bacterium]